MHSQKTDGETKTSFYFTVNICKYVPKMELNPPSTRPSLQLSTVE